MCAAVTHPHEASMLVQTEQCCHLSLPTLAWDCRHSSSFAASRDGEGWEANSIEIRKQTDLWANVICCAHFGENLRKWNSTLQTYIFTLGLLSIIQWAQGEPIFTPPLRLALTVPVHAPDSHWLWSQFYQTLPLNRCAVCLPSPQPLLLLEPGAYGGIQEHKDNFKWDSGYPGCAKTDPSATCHGCCSDPPLPFRSRDITTDLLKCLALPIFDITLCITHINRTKLSCRAAGQNPVCLSLISFFPFSISFAMTQMTN